MRGITEISKKFFWNSAIKFLVQDCACAKIQKFNRYNFSRSLRKSWFSSGSFDGVFMSLTFFIFLIESIAHFAEYACSLILPFRFFLLYTLGVDES